MAFNAYVAKLKNQYDKLILVLVLLGLVGSLLYLALRVGTIRSTQADFIREIDAMRPRNPQAAVEDVAPYREAVAEVGNPEQMPVLSTNMLFVPEKRVWCEDCRQPIPYDAKTCPFCRAKQRVGDGPGPGDIDRDGIDNMWEIKYGLNPYDAGDAGLDPDNDGFTSLEEFLADPPTDPTDPASTPPIEMKLRVERLVPNPFYLRFKSYQRLPGDRFKFQLNMLRGSRQTYFVELGETVQGFEVVDFEQKEERYEQSGMTRRRDVSVLTLQRGDKKIRLVRDKDVQYDEYTAHLHFLIDDSQFELRLGQEFELRDKTYRLIGIDSERDAVVIKRLHDGAEIKIWKFPQAAER